MFYAFPDPCAGRKNSVPKPHNAALPRSNPFLPTYEQHMNDNLRKFGNPEEQENFQESELEGQKQKKRNRPHCCKYWPWLLLTALLTTAIIVVFAEWWSGGFKKHEHVDGSALSTRSEATAATAAPAIATIVITVTVTETATQTTAPSAYASPPAGTTLSVGNVQTTTTVDPTEAAMSASIAAELSRMSSYLANPPTLKPDTTTLVRATPAPPATIPATPGSSSAAPVKPPGGWIGWCGVPGQNCGKA